MDVSAKDGGEKEHTAPPYILQATDIQGPSKPDKEQWSGGNTELAQKGTQRAKSDGNTDQSRYGEKRIEQPRSLRVSKE